MGAGRNRTGQKAQPKVGITDWEMWAWLRKNRMFINLALIWNLFLICFSARKKLSILYTVQCTHLYNTASD